MDLSSFKEMFQQFETQKVMEYLQQLDVQQLLHNPWLLGTVGALALLALIMRWRVLLVTLMSVTGFVWLISYVQQRGTKLEGMATDTLIIFVAGGVGLIALVIYLLFIKAE